MTDSENKLIPGELPLIQFVSSVMTPDLNWARAEVVRSAENIGYLAPWAFEFTPASSERVDDSYLRKVREAAFVVWLVEQSTTVPVVNEIREALASSGRLLIFRLPVDGERDATTTNLIQEVGNRAKYTNITHEIPLRDAFEASLGDEIVRAIRREPTLGRVALLNEQFRMSRARCIARWEAAGISRSLAIDLADDRAIGALGMGFMPTEDKPVVVLAGTIGSGKSLAAERYYQEAIAVIRSDASAPVPLFVEARNVEGSLQRHVVDSATGLGNPRVQGITLVIDGLDEADLGRVAQLLRDAYVLAETWPGTRVLLTSRDIPEIPRGKGSPVVDVPALTHEEATHLVARVAGQDIQPHIINRLDRSVIEAMRTPLFAVLLGTYFGEQTLSQGARSPQHLLSHLVQRSLGHATTDRASADQRLQHLAALSIDRGYAAVPSSEIGSVSDVRALTASRLVTEQKGSLSFPLAILAEWFGAHSLASGNPSPYDLTLDTERLQRWIYSTSLFISMFPHDQVIEVFAPIAAKNPGLAGRIIRNAFTTHHASAVSGIPDSLECGRRIRDAYQAWLTGLGPLGKAIGPVDRTGSILPIGTRSWDQKLMVGIYRPNSVADELCVLPANTAPFGKMDRNLLRVRIAGLSSNSSWALNWAFTDLRARLKPMLENCSLLIFEGPIAHEAAWRTALAVKSLPEFHATPIPLDEIEHELQRLEGAAVFRDKWSNVHELDVLRTKIRQLRQLNRTEIVSPWPAPDRSLHKGNDWVSSLYSDEQLLARVKAVYGGALAAYQDLVRNWFSTFAGELRLLNQMPVRVTGSLGFSSRSMGRHPSMRWRFESLPADEENTVKIELTDNQNQSLSSLVDGEGVQVLLDIYSLRPVTKLAFDWLSKDLEYLGWIDHSRLMRFKD